MNRENRVELLAPAGNVEGFYGAVHAGADAVYLGGSRFGARAYAENFTDAELVECIRYGHLLGRRIYLTVNTLLKEEELNELYDYLNPFYEAGLDAVIVQDTGVLRFIRKHFPALELHASTQMTLCSHYGAELLRELGACRIVPARELSLQELSEIKERTGMELETFIHGAMCYCYSGQCLFSSILGGRSGNRGRCAQPCRLPYRVRIGREQCETCYPMSLKDMCTIEYIPQLIEAGIDSFKIEGRMKKPEYAAGVTAVYRRYIDSYYELREQYGKGQAAERYRVSQEDLDRLSALYIRSGKQEGYYFRHNGRDMVTLSDPAYSGNDEKLLAEVRGCYLEEKLRLPVRVTGSFVPGMPAEVTLQTGGAVVAVQGATVDQAQKQPVTVENVRKQLGKMGDSPFFPEHMELKVGENAFYPLKQINELRREAVLALERFLLEESRHKCQEDGLAQKEGNLPVQKEFQPGQAEDEADGISADPCGTKGEPTGISVSVMTLEQLYGVTDYFKGSSGKRLKRLYIDGDLLLEHPETVSLCEGMQEAVELYIALPYVLRQEDDSSREALSALIDRLPFVRGVLARSLDGLAFARRKGYHNRLDANVYCWNSMSLEEFQSMTAGFCLPLELKAGEQRRLMAAGNRLFGDGKFEKLVYGRIPMMITANCLLKTTGNCGPEDHRRTVLVDRYHKEFPVMRNCRHCLNVIYNSVPLSLHQGLDEWREKADIRLDFTIETGRDTRQILEGFLDKGTLPFKEYTTGHEKRGVD